MFGFRWVLAFAPLLVLGGLAFLPFLFRLPRDIARRMVVSGAVYVGGAYGMELVGGYIASTSGVHGRGYLAEVVVEETLEMVGLTLFVLVLIDLLALQARRAPAAPEGQEHSS